MRKLEIIVLNKEDAKLAEVAGADRLELVANMEVGGLSPELSTVAEVVEAVNIPVNVMVRFDYDSFIYNESQMDRMIAYIEELSKLGINGIVFGSLNQNMQVEKLQLAEIIEASKYLEVTYHRAIDESDIEYENNFSNLSGVVTNVLTSGGLVNNIEENIVRLDCATKNDLRVLVGGGINENNYEQLFANLPNCDFHIGSLAYKDKDFEQGINIEVVKEVKWQLNKETSNLK